jgi:hypothetical protein
MRQNLHPSGRPASGKHAGLRGPLAVIAGLLGLAGNCQAGAVSLDYDPLLGSFAPGLAYRGTMDFVVSNACAGNAAGLVLVDTVAQCGGVLSAATTLTLYEVANPPNFVTAAFNVDVQSLWVENGFVKGWTTSLSAPLTQFAGPPLSTGLDFQFEFIDYLPHLLAYGACNGCGNPGDEPARVANVEGYRGLVIHLRDDGSSALGQECSGKPIGLNVRFNLNTLSFEPTGTPGCPNNVPEPGGLALALAALGAAALWGRRR